MAKANKEIKGSQPIEEKIKAKMAKPIEMHDIESPKAEPESGIFNPDGLKLIYQNTTISMIEQVQALPVAGGGCVVIYSLDIRGQVSVSTSFVPGVDIDDIKLGDAIVARQLTKV